MTVHELPLASWEALLRRYRAQLIADGRAVAEELCRSLGATHSREVMEEMGRRGLLKPEVKGHWIGAVMRDPIFVNTGRIVLPPLALGAKSHDPRLIYLWRLRESGAAPLVLYEYAEYCGQRPAPTVPQRVAFILRHVTITKGDGGWCGASLWPNDQHRQALSRGLDSCLPWLRLFTAMQRMGASSQAKARAEARRLVTEFVLRHGV